MSEAVSLDSVAVLVAALAHARAELAGVTAERDHWRALAERGAAEARALAPRDLQQMLSQSCDMTGSQSAWAQKHRIHRTVVNDTIAGRRDVSPAILNALGFMRVERFIPIKRGSNV